MVRILNEDYGNLSKKLKELRELRKTIFRKRESEDDQRLPHYIKVDVEIFEYILTKLTKYLEKSPAGVDPRKNYYIVNEFGDEVISPNSRICQLIDRFIKSEYTREIIKKYGFEPTYRIFKEKTHGYCEIFSFVELAEDLVKQGKINRKDFGSEFLAYLKDLEKRKEELRRSPDSDSPFVEFEFSSRDWTELLKKL